MVDNPQKQYFLNTKFLLYNKETPIIININSKAFC